MSKASQIPAPPTPRTEPLIPTVAFVQRQFFSGKDAKGPPEVKNETIQVRRFLTEPAKVSVAMGLTLNLGNYEAARIDVSLTSPCYQEERDDAYEDSKRWVETRLQKEVEDIRANKPSLF